MRSLYKSDADREVIARWCRSRLDAWEMVPSLRWLLAPTPQRTESMLEGFTAPGSSPTEAIVQ